VKKYIGHLQVDGKGVAMNGKGWLVGDTVMSRSPCADLPVKCERVVRLEAPLDGRVVRMRVDLEQEGKVALRYSYEWTRLPAGETAAVSVSPPSAGASVGAVPREVAAWLRGLVGLYRARNSWPCTIPSGSTLTDDVCPEDRIVESEDRKFEKRMAGKKVPVDGRCQSIGAGPGLRCAVDMIWPELKARGSASGRGPVYQLYGFDPVTSGITLVSVVPTASIGPAGFATGQLLHGKLTFNSPCGYLPCTGVTQVSQSTDWVRFRTSSINPTSGRPSRTTGQLNRLPPDTMDVATTPKSARQAPTNPTARPR
jgi:hypothetical protein